MSETETQPPSSLEDTPGRAGVAPMNEEAFRLLVDSVRDYAIFMLDPRGYVATWNPGAQRIKGWRADEIVGQHFSRFYPAEDVARRKPWTELEIAAREGRFEDEGWRLHKDGTPFWANVVITAVRSPGGELIGFGKVTRDLTARKQAEEERLAMAAREEGLRAREELLVIAAHELRTPIAALQLQADLVRRGAERSDASSDVRLLERVRRLQHSATRLSRLVEAMLRVASLEPRDIELERTRLDLRALVGRVLDDHRADIAAAGSAVRVAPGPPVPMRGDRALLEVLLANLVSNALKYGGRQPVTFRVEARGRVASVKVEDRGIGIAAERQPALFHRFSRGVSTRHYGGLGLGLWTVRTIAEAHGGSVAVASRPGEGATFEVTLDTALGDEARPDAVP